MNNGGESGRGERGPRWSGGLNAWGEGRDCRKRSQGVQPVGEFFLLGCMCVLLVSSMLLGHRFALSLGVRNELAGLPAQQSPPRFYSQRGI